MGPGFPWLENFDDAAQADFELVNWVEATEADFYTDNFKDVAPREGSTPRVRSGTSSNKFYNDQKRNLKIYTFRRGW